MERSKEWLEQEYGSRLAFQHALSGMKLFAEDEDAWDHFLLDIAEAQAKMYGNEPHEQTGLTGITECEGCDRKFWLEEVDELSFRDRLVQSYPVYVCGELDDTFWFCFPCTEKAIEGAHKMEDQWWTSEIPEND